MLHIGNVANNAYLNAKLLRARGVESDVLCYGNYHFMASPEWEELDQIAGTLDPDRPDWAAVAPGSRTRPPWFVQGPFQESSKYLCARHTGSQWRATYYRIVVDIRRQVACSARLGWLRRLRRAPRRQVPAPLGTLLAPGPSTVADETLYMTMRAWTIAGMRALSAHYDVVHAYGAEPILPMATGTRPYVAWEHGTLRHLPFQDTVEGRLTAKAYRQADAVVITNADNQAAARRLGITRYRFVPHPVNESRPDPASGASLRSQLLTRSQSDFLVFHPSRQHWSEARHPHYEKGNDRLIHGLAAFFRERPRAAAIFVDWGASVDASRALLSSLGIDHRVQWIAPQPGLSLARHMLACDVTADQFHLGSFGSILPRALSLGCPTLIHLDAEVHRWCFSEPPPVMNAKSPQDISAQLRRACDEPTWNHELRERGRTWYDRHHSSAVVADALLALYDQVTVPQ